MNAHTAKLISRYASKAGERPRKVKQEWNALSRQEKARRRAKMKAAVG